MTDPQGRTPVTDVSAVVGPHARTDAPGPPPDAGSVPGSSAAGGGPTVGIAADGIDLSSLLAPPEGPGEIGRFAHYRVVRALGHGGMGIVLLADDAVLGRPVAVKLMLPHSARSAAARARFLREARAAARVRHDHVVNIHRVGEHAGVPYIEMELLHGAALETFLPAGGGPVPTDQALRVAREIADGLRAAHALGVVHRDIKPANIWIEPSGRVRILDFGLAGDADTAADARLTRSGAVIGTPSYMAPEQALGEPADARGDLFSLGVLMYRLTTGRLPFPGKTPAAVMAAVAMAEPDPPRRLNPDVPAPLDRLIARLLAKNPDDRPRTADEVIAELDALGAAPPQPAPAIGSGPTKTAAATRVVPVAPAESAAETSAVELVVPPTDTPWRPPAKARSPLRAIAAVAALATVATLLAFAGRAMMPKPQAVANADPAPADPPADDPPKTDPPKIDPPKVVEHPPVVEPAKPKDLAEGTPLKDDIVRYREARDRNAQAVFLERAARDRGKEWAARAEAGDPAGEFLRACGLAYGATGAPWAFPVFQALADKGFPDAMYEVGAAETDAKAGVDWFLRGAAAGHGGCMYGVGRCYALGRGVPVNPYKATLWFLRAADHGCPQGLFDIGAMCAEGANGVKRDPVQARKWFERAAGDGVPDAENALGELLHDGIPPDHPAAVALFLRAAKWDHPAALYNLGLAYEGGNGTGGLPNEVTAAGYYQKAAARNHPAAQFKLAQYHEKGRGGLTASNPAAFDLYERSARNGNDLAWMQLAQIHYDGRLGKPKNEKEAVRCLEKAYGCGNTGAVKQLQQLATGGSADAKAALNRLGKLPK